MFTATTQLIHGYLINCCVNERTHPFKGMRPVKYIPCCMQRLSRGCSIVSCPVAV